MATPQSQIISQLQLLGRQRREIDMSERQTLTRQVADLKRDVERMDGKLEDIQTDMREILVAWRAAQWSVRLLKWTAVIVGGVVTLWTAAKQWIK